MGGFPISCVGCHNSRAAPQAVQTASPVCGTKNFSSVRLYSAAISLINLTRTVRLGPSICQTVKLTHYPLIPLRKSSARRRELS